jgi:hypothetical protein
LVKCFFFSRPFNNRVAKCISQSVGLVTGMVLLKPLGHSKEFSQWPGKHWNCGRSCDEFFRIPDRMSLWISDCSVSAPNWISSAQIWSHVGYLYFFDFPMNFDLSSFVFWRMPSSGMLHYLAVVRTDVSEEHIMSIIRVTRIKELRTMLAVTITKARCKEIL